MRKLTMVSMALIAVALMTGSAVAGNGTTGQKASKADKTWITGALQTDLAEIQGGELAMKQGSSQEVKKLGQKLARDHAMAGAVDKKVAKKVGATVANAPSAKMKTVLQKLGKLKGAAFDKAYAASQVKGHLEAIAKTKAEIKGGSSALVKKTAQTTLKMLEEHLKLARSVQSGLGSGGGQM